MIFALLALAQTPNLPDVFSALTSQSSCKVSVNQNFGVLLLEKSVNASQRCFEASDDVVNFRFNGTDFTHCIDESAAVAELFKPSSIGAFDTFTTQERDTFHECSHGLRTSDRSKVWKVASAVARRFYACDTSDITEANKKTLTDALVSSQANVVALRSLCITVDRGDDAFNAILHGLTLQLKNLLNLVSN